LGGPGGLLGPVWQAAGPFVGVIFATTQHSMHSQKDNFFKAFRAVRIAPRGSLMVAGYIKLL